MRRLWVILFPLLAILASTAQEDFFPKQAFSDDSWSNQFMSGWYSHELKILEEPFLLKKVNDKSSES